MIQFCSDWELADGDLPNAEIRVLQVVHADGTISFTIKHLGDVPLSQYMGLLDLAKFTLLRQFEEG